MFTVTIVFFGFSPFVQALLVMFSSYLSLLYLIVYRPHKELNTAYFEIYNEATILVVSYGMFLYCDIILSDSARYNLGWALTGFVILNVLLNFLNIAVKIA